MRALITGVTGQDGSYLAEQLAAGGVEVFGLIRGQRNPKRAWIQELVPNLTLIEGDLLDQSSLQRALVRAEPDVVYNLGALTFVGMSWDQPTLMTEVTGLGALRMLEAIRAVNPDIRFVQASSSEQFGAVREAPQNEDTPFRPRSPYGVAKLFAHHVTVNYRESYGMRNSCAIMFNHESPRRGEEFVTQKVAAYAKRAAAGARAPLRLGNAGSQRDWGWAPDFMRALPLIAAAEPDDFVLATGESHSILDLALAAFDAADLDWAPTIIVGDPTYMRPADVECLQGDASKAKRVLGWEASVRFDEIVRRLVEAA